jgi:glycosyltransferase involved in cell wall biosynthesis
MKISGFTYVRNGFKFGYPFIPSIQSLLPIVDELIVVVGDSEDGTREAIEQLNDNKIQIIDSVWDDALRRGGKIFAQQSNLGLEQITGDWAFHLQVDEVLHEDARNEIIKSIEYAESRKEVDAILFPFMHFWGDYYHIRNTRRTHDFEIRIFKNKGIIKSYRDSQGFRSYPSESEYAAGNPGEKLNVIKIDIPIYHYSYTRNPNLMKKKANYFHRFWHDSKWLKENVDSSDFDFNDVDKLEKFEGEHPKYMKETIAAKDWDFEYDPSKSTMSFRDKILYLIEKSTGKRLFNYQNYRLIK